MGLGAQEVPARVARVPGGPAQRVTTSRTEGGKSDLGAGRGGQGDVWAGGPVKRRGIRFGGRPAGHRLVAGGQAPGGRGGSCGRWPASFSICPRRTLRLGAGGGRGGLGFP